MNIGGNIKDILIPQYKQPQQNKDVAKAPGRDAKAGAYAEAKAEAASGDAPAKRGKTPGSDNATIENMLKPSTNRVLRLEINDKLDIIVAKIVNRETGETIRQIPPEKALELMKTLKESKGLMLKEEA